MRYTPLDLLEACGFEFHLDWDGELLIHRPDVVYPPAVRRFVAAHAADIAAEIERRQHFAQRRCYGGPLDGCKHQSLALVFDGHHTYIALSYASRIPDGWHDPLRRPGLLHRQCDGDEAMARARHLMVLPARVRHSWASYELMQDGRAFFRGYATNEAKARRGQVSAGSEQGAN